MPSLVSQLAVAWPPELWGDVTVIVGCSGGADSVALLRALMELRQVSSEKFASKMMTGKIITAHLNHGLRGAEADDDQRFVEDLCQSLGVPCLVERAEVSALAREQGDGLEAAARDARQAFFRRAAQQTGARYVALAHTADDQAETVLHRILRGTGLAGLAGMPMARQLMPGVAIIRPLLAVRRVELRAYLQDLGQSWREDASNLDRSLTRNRLRHDLLPHLTERYNTGVIDALLRLASQASDAHAAVEAWAAFACQSCVEFVSPRELVIDCQQAGSLPRHVLRQMLLVCWREQGWPEQSMGFAEWDSLAGLVARSPALTSNYSANFALNLPGDIRAQKKGEWLSLTRPA